ncbi:hypothetical protein D3C75_936060 [compost metagenome]
MVRVPLLALIKPPPWVVIPFGLAIIRWAVSPATSIIPFMVLALVEVTSFRMTFAVPPAILGLAAICPPSTVSAAVAALLKITPSFGTFSAS